MHQWNKCAKSHFKLLFWKCKKLYLDVRNSNVKHGKRNICFFLNFTSLTWPYVSFSIKNLHFLSGRRCFIKHVSSLFSKLPSQTICVMIDCVYSSSWHLWFQSFTRFCNCLSCFYTLSSFFLCSLKTFGHKIVFLGKKGPKYFLFLLNKNRYGSKC